MSEFISTGDEPATEDARDVALAYLTAALSEAVEDGVPADIVMDTVLDAAMRELVRRVGEESAATIVAGFPERIRRGDYTLIGTQH